MPRLRIAIAAIALLALAGCTSSGGSTLPSDTPLPTAPLFSDTPSTSAVPTLAPAAASAAAKADVKILDRTRTEPWSTVRDRASAASFRLPRVVAATTRTTDGIPQRLYTVQATKSIGVSIAFSEAGSVANVQSLESRYLASIAQQFKSAGATDARILDQKSLRVAGHQAVSGRLVFTPGGSASSVPVVWFIDAVAYGRYLVVAQTITFPQTTDPAYVTLTSAVQKRLVAGLRLP